MKKLYILALFGSIFLSGCDPLGIEPTSAVFEDQFWENPQLSRTFVNQFYLWKPTGANHYFQAEQWSDNAVGNIDRDQESFRQLNFNDRQYDELNGTIIKAPWGEGYKIIRQANLAIERLPTVPNISESDLNQLLAESYAFRAQFYFDMERYWGGMPIITEVMDVFDETMLTQNTREEVFTQILSDYDKSLELFSKVTSVATLGLLNADIVQTLKSRAALAAACAASASEKGIYDALSGSAESKALYKFTKYDAKHYYNVAYTAAKSVLGKYSLDPDYRNLFNGSKGHTSVESMWPMMFNETDRSGFNPANTAHPTGRMYGATSDFSPTFDGDQVGGVGNAFPTQELVDSYYQKDKLTGKWMQWWKTSQAQEMGVNVGANGATSATTEAYQTMYTDRDARFYTTVLYDGSYYANVERERNLVGVWIDYSEPTKTERYSALHTMYKSSENLAFAGRGAATMTGYYPAKYVPGVFKEDGRIHVAQTAISFFMVRYAEVLLNLAEAAYQLGGKENEVVEAVNEIRNRAGLDNFDPAVVGHDLWEEYKLQRRVEFAFEVPGHRYFDLLRWAESEGKTTIDELNKPSSGMFIFRKGIETEKVEENGYPAPKTDPKYFTPFFEVRTIDNEYFERKFDNAVYHKLPFSRTTLEQNLNLLQNPGWDNKSYQ
jgi:hypothetical protein